MKLSELIAQVFLNASRQHYIDESEEIQLIRKRLSTRYNELKRTLTFCESEEQAYTEWLDEILSKPTSSQKAQPESAFIPYPKDHNFCGCPICTCECSRCQSESAPIPISP